MKGYYTNPQWETSKSTFIRNQERRKLHLFQLVIGNSRFSFVAVQLSSKGDIFAFTGDM
jgi:hypothetical protein